MLTVFKKIFIWWNQDTLGTKLKTVLFGNLVGKDSFGNKYYESKKGKRWVIYSSDIEATKIPVEWYSWIHFIPNRIINNHDIKKYEWQKPHQPNPSGTKSAYFPYKDKKNAPKKKYKNWKV